MNGRDSEVMKRLQVDGVSSNLGADALMNMGENSFLASGNVDEAEAHAMTTYEYFLADDSASRQRQGLDYTLDERRLPDARTTGDGNAFLDLHFTRFYPLAYE